MDVIEPQKRKSKGGGGGGKKFHIIISPGARRHTLTAHFQKVASSPGLNGLSRGHQRPRKTFLRGS